MKKIALVCDGGHFPYGAFGLVKRIHENSPLFVTGIFLHGTQFDQYGILPDPAYSHAHASVLDVNAAATERTVARFTAECGGHHIPYSVHSHKEDMVFDPAIESRFSDLMVFSAGSFYKNMDETQPNIYTRNLLHAAECPVIAAPEEVPDIKKIVLLYDGNGPSAFAIKQFMYLFPEWCALETKLLYFGNGEQIPLAENLQELLQLHFPKLSIVPLPKGSSKTVLHELEHETDTLIVCGSYGKHLVPAAFRKSFIAGLLQRHRLPVFIAHT
ncbi:MAG TPA: hypothetical protein VG738_14970 [Chitinophagaceae bacterium]|nr:hypothetical protein [Chitinophagaceae bacterium]